MTGWKKTILTLLISITALSIPSALLFASPDQARAASLPTRLTHSRFALRHARAALRRDRLAYAAAHAATAAPLKALIVDGQNNHNWRETTPILKKLEQTGHISRTRDPSDERQVRVSLTATGRRLVKNDPGGVLVEACGLGGEFSAVQKNVVRLRDNLLRNTRGKQSQAG